MKIEDHQKETLENIGEKYGKSWGQVLLKYQIQRGIIVIPKSHNKDNQAANLNLFDFELANEDLVRIKNA